MSLNWRGGAERWALVVSDDPEFWLSLREGMPEFSKRMVPVRTGRDCLRMIEDSNIRVAVLDGRLPDVSGLHLVHLARRIRPDLGIILAVADTDAEQEQEARENGVLYYGAREGWKEIVQVLRQSLAPTLEAVPDRPKAPVAGTASLEKSRGTP